MYYKLGAQIDIYEEVEEEGKEKYEWNICLMTDKYGQINQNLFIGTRTIHDPIVKLARNLIDELNKESN